MEDAFGSTSPSQNAPSQEDAFGPTAPAASLGTSVPGAQQILGDAGVSASPMLEFAPGAGIINPLALRGLTAKTLGNIGASAGANALGGLATGGPTGAAMSALASLLAGETDYKTAAGANLAGAIANKALPGSGPTSTLLRELIKGEAPIAGGALAAKAQGQPVDLGSLATGAAVGALPAAIGATGRVYQKGAQATGNRFWDALQQKLGLAKEDVQGAGVRAEQQAAGQKEARAITESSLQAAKKERDTILEQLKSQQDGLKKNQSIVAADLNAAKAERDRIAEAGKAYKSIKFNPALQAADNKVNRLQQYLKDLGTEEAALKESVSKHPELVRLNTEISTQENLLRQGKEQAARTPKLPEEVAQALDKHLAEDGSFKPGFSEAIAKKGAPAQVIAAASDLERAQEILRRRATGPGHYAFGLPGTLGDVAGMAAGLSMGGHFGHALAAGTAMGLGFNAARAFRNMVQNPSGPTNRAVRWIVDHPDAPKPYIDAATRLIGGEAADTTEQSK